MENIETKLKNIILTLEEKAKEARKSYNVTLDNYDEGLETAYSDAQDMLNRLVEEI